MRPARIAEQVFCKQKPHWLKLFFTKLFIAALSVKLGRAHLNAIKPMLYTSKRYAGLKISSRLSGAVYIGSHVAKPRPFLNGEDQSQEEPKSIALRGAPFGSFDTTSRFSGFKSLP